MMPYNMKDEPMNSQVPFDTPTQAEVDRFIAQAHQMRSEYFAQLFKSGFARFRGVFSKKRGLGHAPA